MRNICNIDFRDLNKNGSYNSACGCNDLTLEVNPANNQLTNYKVEITDTSGKVHTSEVLTKTNDLIRYDVPIAYWNKQGTMKARLLSSEANSSYISFSCLEFDESNNVYFIYSNGIYTLRRKTEDGSICDKVYPVGSIYMSVNNVNPSTLFGGTWEQLQNRFLVGAGDEYSIGATGGESTHSHTTGDCTLTIEQIPAHTHNNVRGVASVSPGSSEKPNTSWTNGSKFAYNTATESTGGGQAHNHGDTGNASNIPPYLAVFMWKRTG